MKVNGRPLLNEHEVSTIFQKLEPYLMTGLSIRKSCHLAKVPRSTVYCLLERNRGFLDQIARSRQYISVLVSTITSRMLAEISNKQIKGKRVTGIEMDFLQWYALHHASCAEEYGRKPGSNQYDPELEMEKIRILIETQTINGLNRSIV